MLAGLAYPFTYSGVGTSRAPAGAAILALPDNLATGAYRARTGPATLRLTVE